MTQQKKPNIVFMLVDNLGWGDLGCYGGSAPTPRLDALASEGIRFKNYIIGTLLGELPGAFVLTMLGNNLSNINSPWFAVSLVLAVLLFLLPEAYRRFIKKPEKKN